MLSEILETVNARRGIDLQGYRSETLKRGIERRLEATGADARAYRERIGHDDVELDALVSVLLVGVTEMFRDEGVWEALRSVVLPSLLAAHPLLRGWSIGCATGEEAWSLATVLDGMGAPFDLLATDIDALSLDSARARQGAIAERVRERVRFARHDIAGPVLAPPEAVVASFQVVLLRNVLIYFSRPLQARVLARVASVLVPGGALVLGQVEDAASPLLEPWPGLDAALKIYRRRP